MKKIVIIADQSLKPIKFFIDQMPKLAKGLIRLGHDARIINHAQLLRAASPFKSRKLSAYGYKKKVDCQVASICGQYQPDMVYISFGKHINAGTVEAVRRLCPGAVFVGGDGDPWPSLQKDRIETARSLDLLVATNNGRFLDDYRKAGVKNCFFLPNMCDPDIDYRYPVGPEWKSDIIWTGTAGHGSGSNDTCRREIIETIRHLGGTKMYGCLGHPQVAGKDYFFAISGARLGIHVNAVNDVPMYHSDRLTHYLACGTCVLCKRVPESEKLFGDRRHLVYFDTVAELRDLIDYYLNHEEERRTIADQGMAWVHREFNGLKMAQYLLELIEKGTYTAPWTA